MRYFFRSVLPPLLVFVVVVGTAELLVVAFHVRPFILPRPSAIAARLFADRVELLSALGVTASSALTGFVASAIFGILAALLLAASGLVRRAFYPYTLFFQTVPIIAIAPLLTIWFDPGFVSVSIAAFIVSVFPVIANTLDGLLSTEPALVDLFRLYRATRLATLWKLRLPSALPGMLTGLRISAGLAVIGAIVGEFVLGTLGDHEGLGVKVVGAAKRGHTDKIFAAVLVASLLGLVLFTAVNVLRHLLLRNWHASEKSDGG